MPWFIYLFLIEPSLIFTNNLTQIIGIKTSKKCLIMMSSASLLNGKWKMHAQCGQWFLANLARMFVCGTVAAHIPVILFVIGVWAAVTSFKYWRWCAPVINSLDTLRYCCTHAPNTDIIHTFCLSVQYIHIHPQTVHH